MTPHSSWPEPKGQKHYKHQNPPPCRVAFMVIDSVMEKGKQVKCLPFYDACELQQ